MKKITVHGKDNIPTKGAVLFIGNHQNALIDALLIPTTTRRNIHFLARASAFKNSIANTLLRSLNMIPVYRIRDGVNTIKKNHEIFEQCYEYLKKEKAIEIFAEGEHHLERRIGPLKKGFARIIEGTLKKYPDLTIQIVPIGLNYDSHLNYPSTASVYYGPPINANDYFNQEKTDKTYAAIINKVASELKKLTLHVENLDNYDVMIESLEKHQINYLDPNAANNLYKSIKNNRPIKESTIPKKQFNWFYPIQQIAKLNSILPLLIWKYFKAKVSEIIFYNTFRFALILTIFPLFYMLQAGVIYYIFNGFYAFIYLLSCILLGLITTKTTLLIQK